MFARVVSIEVPAADLDEEMLAFRAQVLRAAQARPGFRGAYDLVDRETGRSLALTLWESEEAMRASETARRPSGGDGEPRIGYYEVALALELRG